VAQDNRYATWNALRQPVLGQRFISVDKKGHVVYTHFGEGDYEQTEAKDQVLAGGKTRDSYSAMHLRHRGDNTLQTGWIEAATSPRGKQPQLFAEEVHAGFKDRLRWF